MSLCQDIFRAFFVKRDANIIDAAGKKGIQFLSSSPVFHRRQIRLLKNCYIEVIVLGGMRKKRKRGWRFPAFDLQKVSGAFRSRTLSIVLFYFALSLLATFPLIFYMKSSIVGDYEGDMWKHIWGFWWIKDSILGSAVFPIKTYLLNWPYGGSLFFADPVDAVLSIPLQMVFGLSVSYNIMVLYNLTLGGVGAYFLSYYFIRNRATALISGCIYGYSPYVLAYSVSSGVSETLNIGYIPLFILFFIKTTEEESIKNPIIAALFLFIVSFACWYYGIFTIIFAFLWFVYRFYFHFLRESGVFRMGEKRAFSIFFNKYKSVLFRVALVFIISGILIYPPAKAFKGALESPDNIISPERAKVRAPRNFDEYLGRHFYNFTRLSDLIKPGKSSALFTTTLDKLCRVSFIGFTVLFLTILGCRRGFREKRRDIKFWTLSAIFFLILSLGPYIHFTQNIYISSIMSPPYMLMYNLFPAFDQIAIPFRFVLLFILSCSILSAFGADKIFERYSSQADKILFLLIVFILVEFFILSPAPYPIPRSPSKIPDLYHQLGRMPGDFAILQFPAERGNSELLHGEYFYYQTAHKKKIPYRTSATFTTSFMSDHLITFLHQISKRNRSPWVPQMRTLARSARKLKAQNFKYIIIHDNFLKPGQSKNYRMYLTALFGEPMLFKPGISVYEIK